MNVGTGKKRDSVRDTVRIGQVWRHRRQGSAIAIKQIHRADRTVEAWLQSADGRRSRQVSFAELRRDYELTDQRAGGAPGTGEQAA